MNWPVYNDISVARFIDDWTTGILYSMKQSF